MRTTNKDTRLTYHPSPYLGRLNKRASPLIGFLVTNSDVQGGCEYRISLCSDGAFLLGYTNVQVAVLSVAVHLLHTRPWVDGFEAGFETSIRKE